MSRPKSAKTHGGAVSKSIRPASASKKTAVPVGGF